MHGYDRHLKYAGNICVEIFFIVFIDTSYVNKNKKMAKKWQKYYFRAPKK